MTSANIGREPRGPAAGAAWHAARPRRRALGPAAQPRRPLSLRNGAWFQANGGAKLSRHGIYDYRKEKACASNSTSSIAAQRGPCTSTHGRWGIGKGLACDDKYHGRCDQFTWLGVIRPSGKTAVSNVPFAKENLSLPETERCGTRANLLWQTVTQ